MRNLPCLAVLLLLALAPAAMAQEGVAGPDTAPPPVETAEPGSGCDRGEGTDADYAYCGDPCVDADAIYGADADYVYACESASGAPTAAPRPPTPRPRAVAQPLAADTLPLTGSEAWIVGLLGTGLLLTGTGLRLRTER